MIPRTRKPAPDHHKEAAMAAPLVVGMVVLLQAREATGVLQAVDTVARSKVAMVVRHRVRGAIPDSSRVAGMASSLRAGTEDLLRVDRLAKVVILLSRVVAAMVHLPHRDTRPSFADLHGEDGAWRDCVGDIRKSRHYDAYDAATRLAMML